MAHHKHGFRICPDNDTSYDITQWSKAKKCINGLAFKKDFNEAIALAKLGAISCRIPFIVQMIPIGGKRPRYANTWVIKPKLRGMK